MTWQRNDQKPYKLIVGVTLWTGRVSMSWLRWNWVPGRFWCEKSLRWSLNSVHNQVLSNLIMMSIVSIYSIITKNLENPPNSTIRSFHYSRNKLVLFLVLIIILSFLILAVHSVLDSHIVMLIIVWMNIIVIAIFLILTANIIIIISAKNDWIIEYYSLIGDII